MLERHLEAPSPGKAVGFIAASLFGMAAHLMFLIALGALGVWAIAVLFRCPAVPVVRTLAHLTVLFGVQVIAATLYGAVAWNNLVIGGGAFIPASESVDISNGLTRTPAQNNALENPMRTAKGNARMMSRTSNGRVQCSVPPSGQLARGKPTSNQAPVSSNRWMRTKRA